MNRQSLPSVLLAVLFVSCTVATGVAVAAAPAERAEGPPNIVFFIADDMLPRHFNFLPQGKGRNFTPTIDRLASEGTVLLGQHVVSPVCTPSRYNCLTGRYASRALTAQASEQGQTVVTWNTHIDSKQDNLPKRLQKLGYATGIVGKNHVVSVPGWKKIQYEADPQDAATRKLLADNAARIKKTMAEAGFDYSAGIYHNNPDGNGSRRLAVHNLDWIAEGAVEFVKRYHQKPFFLYFASTIPHGPTDPARSWKADPRVTADGILDLPPDVLPPRDSLPKRLQQAGIRGWGCENLLWLDDAVAAVMEQLKVHGVLDNTIVFFFNDHGQKAKGTLYQGGVTNPSIIWRRGGFPCGSTSKALLSNVDFAPTIIDFAGGTVEPDTFDGVSIRPLLEGRTDRVRNSLYFEMGFTRAVRKGDWKYLALRYTDQVRNMPLAQRKRVLERVNANLKRRGKKVHSTNPEDPFSHISAIPGGGDAEHGSMGKYPAYYDEDQLYHLSRDPGEQNNLATSPEHAATLAEMKRLLDAHVRSLPGTFGEFGGDSAGSGQLEMKR